MTLTVLGKPHIFPLPGEKLLSSSDPGFRIRVNGKEYEMVLSWNKDVDDPYYSITFNTRAGRLKRIYPGQDEWMQVRNFNPDNELHPHAFVILQDLSKGSIYPTPESMAAGWWNIAIIPFNEVE